LVVAGCRGLSSDDLGGGFFFFFLAGGRTHSPSTSRSPSLQVFLGGF
jgi:hypothetical protein